MTTKDTIKCLQCHEEYAFDPDMDDEDLLVQFICDDCRGETSDYWPGCGYDDMGYA